MDVDTAHAQVLLASLVGVDVVISKNNTPSHGTVEVQKNENFHSSTPVWHLVIFSNPRILLKINILHGNYIFGEELWLLFNS